MSDYILHNRELFKDSSVLELGAGVGVVSIVASLMGAKCVLCTGLCKNMHAWTYIHPSMYNIITHSYTPPPQTHTHYACILTLKRYWKSSIGCLSEKCPS
jgi:predicted nicotinamide N-methyase